MKNQSNDILEQNQKHLPVKKKKKKQEKRKTIENSPVH